MVAHNPLFSGRWTLEKFQATVINDIWPETAFFTLIALMVSLVSELTPHKLEISGALLTVLGTVLGLVISFRTSSAYERYQDGRKMWTTISVASRNLAMMIWVYIPTERQGRGDALQTVIEKKTMVNLIQAYAVSLKHFLRGEPGVYYKDLFHLISFLPGYANAHHHNADMLPLWAACHDPSYPHPHSDNPREAFDDRTLGHHVQRTTSLPADHNIKHPENEKSQSLRSRPTSDPEQALPEDQRHRPLRPDRNPPESTVYDYVPLFRLFRFLFRLVLKRTTPAAERAERLRRKKLDKVESNVPLEIILILSSYTNHVARAGYLQPPTVTAMMNNIGVLQDSLSNLERVRNTPLPFAYQAHLRMSLWLYLLFLPFQIHSTFRYWTIAGTAFASFLLLGFLEIGQEIENPFNYDLNDLDLDAFCKSLQRELHEITAFTNPDPASYLFDMWNRPLAPADERNAADLIHAGDGQYRTPDSRDAPEPGMASIRRTLVENWRRVDESTRKE